MERGEGREWGRYTVWIRMRGGCRRGIGGDIQYGEERME